MGNLESWIRKFLSSVGQSWIFFVKSFYKMSCVMDKLLL